MNQKGFGLPEAIISIVMLSIIMFSVILMFEYAIITSVKTREQIWSSRLGQAIFTKLKTIDYYYLYEYDSVEANFGLSGTYGPITSQTTVYPYRGVLQEIDNLVKRYKFDRWQVQIVYVLRDLSDIDGDGLINDLRDFVDTDTNGIDDYDPSVRYYDSNNDNDYYDTYFSTALNKTCSELPDTNLKKITLKFYKRGRVIKPEQTQLISLELFTGLESKASGAQLKLYIIQPQNATYLYDLTTSQRLASFNLIITKSYPESAIAYRADSISPIRLWGETNPNATVRFYINTPVTVLDTIVANMVGEFDFQSINVTTNLTEGENTILAQTTKEGYYSPYTQREVLLDLNPPNITDMKPTGTVNDLMPYVGAVLTDTVLSTGIPSGICPDVITLKKTTNAVTEIVTHTYDTTSGKVAWVDPSTNLPPLLSTGVVYTITLEGGDNAHYKVISTWSFTVEIQDPDNSAPSIAEKSPIGSTKELLPEISCRVFDDQSGINPYSIVMKLDSNIVVSNSNISSCYNPDDGFVRYKTTTPLSVGLHTVEITVSHWATQPSDKVTSVDTWNFIYVSP